ncbi:FUN14 domain-containing protein [Deinococcus sonorensis]|uniref:FUN14 domain-containing protein n=2 Tax=Deinococcus sonorensis TaxID=309891 RepID=A0AAU7U7U0_9DEIO
MSLTLPQSLSSELFGVLPELSLGAIFGYCAGYAIKKIGRMTLLLVGLLFLAVQILAWQGLVTVHWSELQARAAPWLQQGGQQLSGWGLKVLTTNLPFGGAFVAALLVGLRAR